MLMKDPKGMILESSIVEVCGIVLGITQNRVEKRSEKFEASNSSERFQPGRRERTSLRFPNSSLLFLFHPLLLPLFPFSLPLLYLLVQDEVLFFFGGLVSCDFGGCRTKVETPLSVQGFER